MQVETLDEYSGITEKLCSFVASTSLADIPEAVVIRGTHILLDGIACGLLAARTDDSSIAVKAMTRVEPRGSATVWGWDRTVSPGTAALLNGSFVQGFELDDYHSLGPLHSAACVAPAVLAIAESVGNVTGSRFLESVLLGFEAGPRIGMGLGGLALIDKGWHCGSVYGSLASAVGSGKMYGLDARGMEHALGIAATQASGLMSAQYEGMVKRMHSGMAARNGLIAGALAAEEFSGITQVLEREYGGFATAFRGSREDLKRTLDGLGEHWEIERIAVKPPLACMGGLHSSVEAVRLLNTEESIDPDDVESIDITLGHTQYLHAGWDLTRPAKPIGAQMNVAYAVCVALVDGDAFVPQFAPSRVNADDVWPLLGRTSVHDGGEETKALDGIGFGATVRIVLRDGRVRERIVNHPEGGSLRPLTNEQIVTKYRRMAALVMDDDRAEKLEDVVLNIADAPSISVLTELLRADVTSPFDD